MSATTVRNAYLTQLQGDAALLTEFGANIKKGVETHFDIKTATKGVRLAMELSRARLRDLTSRTLDAFYGYSVIAYFYETDPEKVDDRMTLYDELIREATEKTLDLGIGVHQQFIGQTSYRKNAQISNLFFCVIPALFVLRELRGNR